MRPHSSFVYFTKCFNDHVRDDEGGVLLYKPDGVYETTNFCELIGVGPDCKYFLEDMIGAFCLLPEFVSGMHRLGSMTEDVEGEVVANEDFAIKEEVLMDHMPAIFTED